METDIKTKAILGEIIVKLVFVSAAIIEDMALIYAQDITELANSQNQLIYPLLFRMLLLLITKQITCPIIRLQKIAKRIAGGELTVRVQVKGKGEATAAILPLGFGCQPETARV